MKILFQVFLIHSSPSCRGGARNFSMSQSITASILRPLLLLIMLNTILLAFFCLDLLFTFFPAFIGFYPTFFFFCLIIKVVVLESSNNIFFVSFFINKVSSSKIPISLPFQSRGFVTRLAHSWPSLLKGGLPMDYRTKEVPLNAVCWAPGQVNPLTTTLPDRNLKTSTSGLHWMFV